MKWTLLASCLLLAALPLPASAVADSYTTGLEPPAFNPGIVGGGWANGVPTLDAAIVASTGNLNAGTQALRMSNAVASISLAQLRTPALADPAGETGAGNVAGAHPSRFDASFTFAAYEPTYQLGLSLHVSPTSVTSRTTAVRIHDEPDGLVVESLDPIDNGPGVAVGWLPYKTLATGVSRTERHTLRFLVDYLDGPSNDVVRIYLDGTLIHTNVTWEQYYRHDPEQAPTHRIPLASALLFHARTNWDYAAPALAGKGLIIDDVSLQSTATPEEPPVEDPPVENPPVESPPVVVPPPVVEPPAVDPPAEKADERPPTLGSTGRATTSQGGFLEKKAVDVPAVTCSERCTVKASGQLSLKLGGKPVKLKVVKQSLAPGKPARIALVLSAKARKALRAKLAAGAKVTATIVLEVKDRAGNVRTVRRTIRLKP